MAETKWVATPHFADGKDCRVPGKFVTRDEAQAKVRELLAEDEILDTKDDAVVGWRTAQVVRWEVKPEPRAGQAVAGGAAPARFTPGGRTPPRS